MTFGTSRNVGALCASMGAPWSGRICGPWETGQVRLRGDRPVGRQELLHLGQVSQDDLVRDVGEEIPVLADQLGQHDAVVLSHPEVDQGIVNRPPAE